jgi:hypothetical protein
MKDVSCQEKAPFICQYNPGEKLCIAYITHIALEAKMHTGGGERGYLIKIFENFHIKMQ